MDPTESTEYRTPIHQTLVRERLALGGEPPLVYASAGICSIAFITGDVRAFAFCIMSWTLTMIGLRRLAKVDPQFSEVYRRYYSYPAFIPAQPSVRAGRPRKFKHQ